MTNRLLIFIAGLIFVSCGQEKSTKTIEIGDYLFDFPSDFELIKEQGVDSYVRKIKGDSITLGFDFGNYSSDFGKTAQEYLDEGSWKLMAET